MREPTKHHSEWKSASSTSRSLLAQIRAKDEEAWQRLVTLYAPLVCQWCRRWELQEADIADIFQEVFQSVASGISSFQRTESHHTFRGWLHTITKNKVNDHFRKHNKQPQGIGGSTAQMRWAELRELPTGSDDSSDDQHEVRGLFLQALELIRTDFAENTWQAFWKTVVDNRSTNDVADELSMSPGAVRVAKCRVLHRLRLELGDLEI